MTLGKSVRIGIPILLLCILLATFQVSTVSADVPDIVSVAYRTVGSALWLDITIRHGGPSSIHYVSQVQLEVNGTTQNLAQTPQSTENFVVSYNLGSSSNKYSVRARALCNLHGYSTWSSPTVVPEFSFYAMILFLALATLAIVVARNPGLRKSTRTFLNDRSLEIA